MAPKPKSPASKPPTSNAHYRQILEDNVREKLGLTSKVAATNTVNAVFSELEAILVAQINSKGFTFLTPLGTFRSVTRKATTGHNPGTGVEIPIPECNKIVLKVSSRIQKVGKK